MAVLTITRVALNHGEPFYEPCARARPCFTPGQRAESSHGVDAGPELYTPRRGIFRRCRALEEGIFHRHHDGQRESDRPVRLARRQYGQYSSEGDRLPEVQRV